METEKETNNSAELNPTNDEKVTEPADSRPRVLSEHAQRIFKFMRLAGQELPSSPTMPSSEVRILRVRLLLEELLEYAAASGVAISLTRGANKDDVDVLTHNGIYWHVDLSMKDFVFDTTLADGQPRPTNLVEMADGLADLSVVTVGAMLACGIDDVGLLAEVDDSNLRKFGPGGYKDEHGKWQKPPDFKPPDVAKVLKSQGWKDG